MPFQIEWLTIIVVIAAYALDLLIGDPLSLPHPVRWIGRFISMLEKILRRSNVSPASLRLAGFLLSIIVVLTVYALSAFALFVSYKISPLLFFFVAIIMLWSTLSVRGLHKAAYGVLALLKSDNLIEARRELSLIVGRDTGNLTPADIEKAVVETVSENTSDGIVAPLFFFAIGGPPLALAYKAVNTLDSMLGYKNETYLDFGRFPARLDDLVNFIPARLTAIIMVAASFLLGLDWRGSARILIRDGSAHPSPNAGRPEAAVAGALGMTLGGASFYGDREVVKPLIGESSLDSSQSKVASTVKIMHLTGLIMAALVVIFIYFN